MTMTLPNATREQLIQAGTPETALLLDALYFLNCTTNRPYSIAAIAAMTRVLGISEKVIRTAVCSPVFRKSYQATAGRKRALYTLPTAEQVTRFYLVLDMSTVSDSLPKTAFRSVHAYKRGLHIAMMVRLARQNKNRFRLSRKKQAARLAVTTASIRNYERDSIIIAHHIVTITEIKSTFCHNLPQRADGDHSRWLRVIFPDGHARNYPAVNAIAAKALSAGCRVLLLRQGCNEYSIRGSERSTSDSEHLPSKHGVNTV